MMRLVRLVAILLFLQPLSACQRSSQTNERVRIVPQVSAVEPRRVLFSPLQINRLLVMEGSGFVTNWDLSSSDQSTVFSTMAAGAVDVAFAPDGRFVCTTGIDGLVRRWSADGQLEWVSKVGHHRRARAIAISSDLIASGAEDGTIRVWQQDGTALAEIPNAHDGPVISIAISPTGDLVSLGGDEIVRMWKQGQRTPTPGPLTFEATQLFAPETRAYPHGFLALFRFSPSWGWDRSVAFSPKGDVIAAVLFDGSLRLWNADGTARAVAVNAHGGKQVRSLSFSPQGDVIASAGFDGTTRLWNLDASPHGEPIDAHLNNVFSVAFSLDGSRLATTGLDNVVRVWNRDGSLALELPSGHTDRVITVAVAKDKPILAAAFKGGRVRLWNLDGAVRGELVTAKDLVAALAFSPTEDVVAAAGSDGWLRFWNLDGKPRGKPVPIARDGRRKVSVALSPTGEVAVGSSAFHVWSNNKFLSKQPLRPADDIITIAFSPKGDFIVTGSALGDLQVWNMDGSSRVGPLKQPSEWITAVAVPPEGDYFAAIVGGRASVITLFNLDGTPRGTPLEGHIGHVKTLAFAPDRPVLVSGADDGVVRFWNIPARTVETLTIGAPIDQIGFGGELLWVRAKERLFFFNQARQLVATVHLRATGLLTSTPDGWFTGTGNAPRVVRAFAENGTPLSSEDTARYFSPSKVMAAFTSAAK